MVTDHLTRGKVQGGEQGCRAVPPVALRFTGHGAPNRQSNVGGGKSRLAARARLTDDLACCGVFACFNRRLKRGDC
jgi:hypothetical protein